jgi:uncharacterized protein YndB with AHSA1/START domain
MAREVRREIRTRATPEQVWQALTDPKKITGWFPDHAEGEVKAGEIVEWSFDGFGSGPPMKVREVVPGERVVFGSPEGDFWAQEFTISREGGETVVRVVHSGFGPGGEFDDLFDGVDSGWQLALATLKHYLENYFGLPRAGFLLQIPGEFEYSQVAPLFQGAGIQKWLAKSGSIGAAGERYSFEFKEGGAASGVVLARSAREVMISWSEIRGTLSLKAFAAEPPKRVLCLNGWGWGLGAADAQRMHDFLIPSIDRLAILVLGPPKS